MADPRCCLSILFHESGEPSESQTGDQFISACHGNRTSDRSFWRVLEAPGLLLTLLTLLASSNILGDLFFLFLFPLSVAESDEVSSLTQSCRGRSHSNTSHTAPGKHICHFSPDLSLPRSKICDASMHIYPAHFRTLL